MSHQGVTYLMIIEVIYECNKPPHSTRLIQS